MCSVPVCSEFDFGVLTGDQLWNQGQVGDLCSSPAELKDDDERHEVDKAGPLRGEGVAAQTLVKDEGEGHHHAQGAWVTHTHTNMKW